MSDRTGYVTVRVSMLPDPIEVPLDELEVLRSQGLLATTPPPVPAEPEAETPEPPETAPAPASTSTRKAKS